ncbi:hypothetical protein ACFSFY_12460 [Sporosarcina siberiensis]|uniref:Uncharacterized protein n=1 Tax=Sporosarcina siberiensis TaxID=1365606 RepID=A0ABW4SIL2_9BACL
MLSLFSRRQRNKKVDLKLSPQEIKKIKIINRVKELDKEFNISSEHINSSFDNGLFIDEKQNRIGVYNAKKVVRYGSYLEHKEVINERFIIIPFIDLEMVSIMFQENKPVHIYRYNNESIFLMSDYKDNIFIKDQNLQQILMELDKVAISINVAVSVSINFLRKYQSSENKYEYEESRESINWEESFNYNRDIEELKNIITIFFKNMLSVEPLYIEKEIIKEEKIKLENIGERVKYLEKNSVRINDTDYLTTHLINSWEYIIDEISQVLDYKYYFDSIVLKAVRNKHIYLSCSPEDMKNLEIPEIKSVVDYVFKEMRYDQVSIVPSDFVIEKVPFKTYQLICEQILKEVIDRWEEDFPKLKNSKIRAVESDYIYIDYDGNKMEDLIEKIQYDDQIFEVINLLTGYEKIEVLFVNSKDSIAQIGLNNLDELWNVVQLFIENNQLNKYSSTDLSTIKIHGYDNDNIFIYFSEQNISSTYLSFDEARVIEYALLIYTGKSLTVQIIEHPVEISN